MTYVFVPLASFVALADTATFDKFWIEEPGGLSRFGRFWHLFYVTQLLSVDLSVEDIPEKGEN